VSLRRVAPLIGIISLFLAWDPSPCRFLHCDSSPLIGTSWLAWGLLFLDRQTPHYVKTPVALASSDHHSLSSRFSTAFLDLGGTGNPWQGSFGLIVLFIFSRHYFRVHFSCFFSRGTPFFSLISLSFRRIRGNRILGSLPHIRDVTCAQSAYKLPLLELVFTFFPHHLAVPLFRR